MARVGLPKKYIEKWGITKKAWREYHKAQARRSKHISRSRKVTKRKNPKRRRKTVARRKKNRKKPGFTIPLSIVAPIAAIPFVPSKSGWASPFEDAKRGDWKAVGAHLVNGFQPFIDMEVIGSARFRPHLPIYLTMIAGGVITHKILSKLGVNRALGRAGVPIIRV